jgi:hypothetical protein
MVITASDLLSGMLHQVAVQQKIDQFKGMDYTFSESRQCKLIENLLKVRDGCNVCERLDLT